MHLLVLSAFRRWWTRRRPRTRAVSMHLLVLSAFRRLTVFTKDRCPAVSMHLLVLSAFRPKCGTVAVRLNGSQCTFWCSVLSDVSPRCPARHRHSLNAPFGAQCFPTKELEYLHYVGDLVSMHLLVLSAFRLQVMRQHPRPKSVSMHLLVLSAFRLQVMRQHPRPKSVSMHLLVLSAFRPGVIVGSGAGLVVSMHLLVLSAFRLILLIHHESEALSLNAPFGAQCFPTRKPQKMRQLISCLNAPFGAQCFPTQTRIRQCVPG